MKNAFVEAVIDTCDNCETESNTLWEMTALGQYCCPDCYSLLEKSMKRNRGNKFSRFADDDY